MTDKKKPDYFSRTGSYKGSLPWKKKFGSSSVEVTHLTVSADGIVEIHAQRISMYNDVMDKWKKKFRSPEAGSYTKKTLTKGIPGVVYSDETNDWSQFSKDSNCERLWETAKAFLDAHEPDFVPGSDVPKGTPAFLKAAAVALEWKWSKAMQLRCFAAYHNLSTVDASYSLKLTTKKDAAEHFGKDQPKTSEFPAPLWEDLRKDALSHTLTAENDYCLTCLIEADKQGGAIPEKVKMVLALAKADDQIGTQSDTPVAKQIRWQVSAFAYYHEINRWKASEHIKNAGEWGAKLIPFLVPAEKDAAKPDYYKLQTHDYPDIFIALEKGGGWTCTCSYCTKQRTYYNKHWPKGSNVEIIQFPEFKELFPDAPKKATKNDLLGFSPFGVDEEQIYGPEIPTEKLKTSGPKNVICLLTEHLFIEQVSIFAALHGIDPKTTYELLPPLWKEKFPKTFMKAAPEPTKYYTNPESSKPWDFGEIAVAINCKCSYCTKAIKKTPAKTKKAMAVKKPTKKAVAEFLKEMDKTMGEGLTVDPSALEVPILDQVKAFCLSHGSTPAGIWEKFVDQEKFGKQPFHPEYEPEDGDTEFNVWPDIDTGCTCSECEHSRQKAQEEQPVSEVEDLTDHPEAEAQNGQKIMLDDGVWMTPDLLVEVG